MKYEEKIKWILTTFFRVTQIEALYIDDQIDITSCQFQTHIYEDFRILSMGEIEGFLRDIFSKRNDETKDSYTYYLRHNFICNISILETEDKRIGAIVTQPIILNAVKREELDLKCASLSEQERDMCRAALSRAPAISQNRVIPIGGTLSSLVKHAFESINVEPVVCSSEMNPLSHQLLQPGRVFNSQHKPLQSYRFGGYSTYLKIKNSISMGDSEALLEAFNLIDNENVPMDQHASKDIIRSIKNRLIEGCAMCSFFAIEAQAPYDKTRDFIEQVIREIEGTNNISEMYNLVRSALRTLTRYVAAARIDGYTKHVRLATEYIEKNYAEEISLDLLAKLTDTSKFYLSSLIKKETGLSVIDIINRTRVEESKKMLMEPTINIPDISAKVGFTSSSYFSKVFKQHTSMTPREYSKTAVQPPNEDAKSKDILRALLEQLFHTMELFHGVFDVGRIVDPILNKTWMIDPSGKVLEGTCYDFWSKKRSCDTCISHMALNEDRPFMKMERKDTSIFFVSAIPIKVGDKKLVVELLKKTDNNFFDCTKIETL